MRASRLTGAGLRLWVALTLLFLFVLGSGLQQLSTIDSDVSARRSANRIELVLKNQIAYSTNVEDDFDAQDWGEVTSDVLAEAALGATVGKSERTYSAPLATRAFCATGWYRAAVCRTPSCARRFPGHCAPRFERSTSTSKSSPPSCTSSSSPWTPSCQ